MRCLSNFGKSALLAAVLATNFIAVTAAINCAPADDDGSPLTGSSSAGDFVTCTYQGAGPCTYFPTDGSFSSGASTCPPGLPQGDAVPDPSNTPTPIVTDTPTSTPAPAPPTSTSTSAVQSTSTSVSTSTTPLPPAPSTTAPPPPPPRTTTQTEEAPPPTSTAPSSTPQASSLGVFTTSSPSVITATTVVIVSALVGLPNLLGIVYALASV